MREPETVLDIFVSTETVHDSASSYLIVKVSEEEAPAFGLITVMVAETKSIGRGIRSGLADITPREEYYYGVAMFYGHSVSRLRQVVAVELFHREWSAAAPSQKTHSASSGSLRCNGDPHENFVGELNRTPLRH